MPPVQRSAAASPTPESGHGGSRDGWIRSNHARISTRPRFTQRAGTACLADTGQAGEARRASPEAGAQRRAMEAAGQQHLRIRAPCIKPAGRLVVPWAWPWPSCDPDPRRAGLADWPLLRLSTQTARPQSSLHATLHVISAERP
jgi:hypothetical protein